MTKSEKDLLEEKNTQEQIRLNALLSVAEKNIEQDEKIQQIIELVNKLMKEQQIQSEKIAELKKHLDNGWKEDLIKKITEQMSFSVTKMAETAFETKAQIYNESQKSRIINWKEKIFELLLQVFATGGILWLLADKLIK